MNKRVLISDLLAGLSVSFAALALGAAFGIMSGRGAFAGMIAAAVIPIITGLFGGTRLSVSGPTGPMTAVSSLVVAFAYENFEGKIMAEQFITLVFLMLGVLLLLTSVFRLAKFILYVPQVVILGFMSGIAMLIWMDQVRVIFGLDGKVAPDGSLLINILLALATVCVIFLIPVFAKRFIPPIIRPFVPATLTAIIIMTVITSVFNLEVGHIKLGTDSASISDLASLAMSYIPSMEILKWEYIWMALPYALQLCLLGYLDSLLTALIMDNLTKEKSNYNKELFGQGLSNIASAVLMGIPGAQATIRSVLLFKEGAVTRLAAVATGVIALILFLVFKDYVTIVTSAVFIGVLLKAAYDVFEREFLTLYLQRKWYLNKKRNIQQGFVMYTMLATAFIDLNFAVFSGTLFFYL
ncbi:MAG: SulP family inorganic anion transporter, partial [Saprospiraceae bacterium]